MRALLALVCLLHAGVCVALETARGLAASGAPNLALARVEQLQPADTAAARWAEWEVLRLDLLVGLGRNEEALRRAAALAAGMAPGPLRQCLLSAARAAVAAGQAALARAYAARLLWQLDAPAGEARAARLLVIESYFAERQPEAAFRAMLRFEQDYHPLEREIAGRFAERLLDFGLAHEAVNWMARLEEGSALKLQLRLQAGLIAPEAAVTQARALAEKTRDDRFWRIIAEAAEQQRDSPLRAEALERLVGSRAGQGGGAPRAAIPAATLWQAYAAAAQAAANQERLLTGDDIAWQDFAARRLGSHPALARALFAHLARQGAAPETRLGAQLQLVFSLYQSGLDRTAVELFRDEPAPDPQARYLLGKMAEASGMPALAVRYWHGLSAPADVAAEEWPLRIALMQWRSGMEQASLDTARAALNNAKGVPEAVADRALALAAEMRGAGKPTFAEALYAALLPRARGLRARDALLGLGEIAQAAGQFSRAADYFLRAALADEAPASAHRARLAAAENLARAGYRADARAQFRWILDHSKDPAELETARRELARP